jgi:outer membrane immunogenic protein
MRRNTSVLHSQNFEPGEQAGADNTFLELNMTKYLVAGAVAAAFLSVGTASAADLPNRKAAPVAPFVQAPSFTWTGLYAGLNAGYAFGKFNDNNIGGRRFRSADGFVGGGQIGYNYQINQLVLGVEADGQMTGFDAKGNRFVPGGYGKGEVGYYGTVRGRVGYAMGRTMLYGTGGWAYGQAKVSTLPGVAINGLASDKNNLTGYAVGAGVEHAITNNFTVRGEYMYVDLDKKSYFLPNTKVGTDFSVVRLGANYKF